ncbi:hypothetical protein AB0M29_07550 [Streptomyces sp. NPDC051976]|uniref:hypothetical protein n=1 Tax=Streptomyces sp. NPDC051976 TaxID=3154947 RepID=UPI0034460DE1
MHTTRTAVAAGAALAALLATAGAASADSGTSTATSSTAPSAAAKAHKAPAGDGARALCRRVPRIEARISRALKRLNGPDTEIGSVARLQERVNNAKAAGHTEIETYLNNRLTFRKSLIPMLTQRNTDLAGVSSWCGTHDNGKGSAKDGGTAK